MFHFTSLKHFFQTKRPLVALVLILILPLLVYLKTMAPSYTWQHWGSDAGDLITSVYHWGVPHPPGTPIYVLLAQLFRFLPVGDPAFKLNFGSAFFALGAFLVLFITVFNLTKNLLASSLAVWFLAFSPTFWGQSIITEVYTLHVLLSGLVIYFLIRWQLTRPDRKEKEKTGESEMKNLGLAVFCFGLALSNHTSSLMLFPAIFYLVLAIKGQEMFRPRFLLLCTFFLLLGLLPYLYLPLRARADPPLNWGNPSNLSRFLAHVTGREYEEMLFYKDQRLVVDSAVGYFLSLFKNFNFLGVSLAALGLYFGLVKRKLLLNFSLFIFLFQLLFNANYRIPNIETFYLVSFFVFSIWVGLGAAEILVFLKKLKTWLARKWSLVLLSLELPSPEKKAWDLSLASFLVFVLGSGLFLGPFFNLVRFYQEVDLSSDWEAVAYGEGVFRNLEENAILITEGDKFVLALDYYRWVVYPDRKDVAVFPNGIYLQNWRLEKARKLYPWIDFPDFPEARDGFEAMDSLLALIEANLEEYPIYLTLDYPSPEARVTTRIRINQFILQSEGPVYKVVGRTEDQV